jgi:hypothetical protein
LSGCASEYLHTVYGIKAYEDFDEPRRVLVDKKTGTVVIDADAFYFKPSEKKFFYGNYVQSQPRSARGPARPVFRRFIVTDAANINLQIHYDLESGKKWSYRQGEAPDEIDIDIYKTPAGPFFEPWRVVPEEFDAPPATDAQLALLLPHGYKEYPWGPRIPWVADDGKTYQLELSILAPSGTRFERTATAKVLRPVLTPVAAAFDIVTLPAQIVGIFVVVAIWGF